MKATFVSNKEHQDWFLKYIQVIWNGCSSVGRQLLLIAFKVNFFFCLVSETSVLKMNL